MNNYVNYRIIFSAEMPQNLHEMVILFAKKFESR